MVGENPTLPAAVKATTSGGSSESVARDFVLNPGPSHSARLMFGTVSLDNLLRVRKRPHPGKTDFAVHAAVEENGLQDTEQRFQTQQRVRNNVPPFVLQHKV